MKSVDEQLKLLEQGVEKLVTRDELKKKLEQNRPLRIKLGCDPTAPDLHLGHSVVLRKLRQFQDLGHKAVLIIGDYTALIGDPTGQNKTRPMLSDADIERNAKTYFDQAGKILDTAPDKLEIHRNSEWLGKMNLADTLRLASQMTVARMLERDTFEIRYKAAVPIGVHEFLYPLMQGHDSVMIKADVELGGTDQLFNNLVGRDLQRGAGQEPQVVMILPILEGLDGTEKMSKSKGNYIGINDSPKDMFGKTMSIGDELMARWYELLLGSKPEGHPMEAKKALAHAIVERYHGKPAADHAREDFEKQFSKKDYSEAAEPLSMKNRKSVRLLDLLWETNKFKSRGHIRTLFEQGAIKLDGRPVTDPNAILSVAGEYAMLCEGKNFNYEISTVRSDAPIGILRAGKLVVFRLQQ
ncbi:MAG TPA: tyrosine--tRNA ligase [Verrucomicrobiae bacterium]|nr:tyrosine--tRNA ligase [Verrucomicrobiae bacterium]